MTRRLKVLIQQQVLPPYRVPFFRELGRRVDLTVSIADNVRIPGVGTAEPAPEERTFTLLKFPERMFLGRAYQEGAVQHALATRPDVLVAGGGYLPYLAWARGGTRRLERAGIGLMTWGCSGYEFDGPEDWRRFAHGTLRRRLHHAYLGHFYRGHVRGFISYSAHTSEHLSYAYAIPGDRLFVAENAVDTAAIEGVYAKVATGALRKAPDRIVFVGRLIPSKGVDALVRVFASIAAGFPTSQLVIAGDGPHRTELEEIAAGSGLLGDRIRFCGHVGDKRQLAEILAGGGIFVLPGYGGLAINEAMAAGMAIVCSRGDGTEKHLVAPGENGLLLPRNDVNALRSALVTLLQDPALVQAMGQASFHRITRIFTLAHMVDRYVAALDGASGRQRAHPTLPLNGDAQAAEP